MKTLNSYANIFKRYDLDGGTRQVQPRRYPPTRLFRRSPSLSSMGMRTGFSGR